MNPRQILIILLAVVLAILLYFAPKIASEKKQEVKQAADFITQFEDVRKTISSEQKILFDKLEAELKNAQTANTEKAWMTSASDFLKGARFVPDDKKAILYQGAMKGFEKVLTFNPNNLSAKTKLGASIVESAAMIGQPPMKGISLLKEVVQKDSDNIEANLQLGLFSVTSRQFDKAIQRFQRILRIDSTHIDMYVYLGDTYMNMGEKQKAIESYESYKAKVKDSLIVKNIDDYIKKLKQQQ